MFSKKNTHTFSDAGAPFCFRFLWRQHVRENCASWFFFFGGGGGAGVGPKPIMIVVATVVIKMLEITVTATSAVLTFSYRVFFMAIGA